jgi:hypothetical protein
MPEFLVGVAGMQHFVNREAELQFVEEKFSILLEKNNFVRTPIIEFHGVGGIGKTTMLRKIEKLCHDMHLPSIWTDASQSILNSSREIIQQIQQYNVQFIPKSENLPEQSVHAARALLLQGPMVFLVDSLDAANEEQLIWIENMLRDLIGDNKLLAILASKRLMPFESTMSIARRFTHAPLKPFDRDSCMSFIDGLEQEIEPEIRDIVFEWTHGYPLAVNAMVRAIRINKFDPRKEQDQRQLLAIMSEQVINRGVFSNIVQAPDNLKWYQTMLSLFSIPRRFNLTIMQKMTEKFAPQYKLDSSLAYISLPRRISQTTDVLNWNSAKAGFSVEAPIRHIFLTKLKLEDPDTYATIHRFLALTSRQFADQVSGSDRVRYLQEYLYHSANYEEGTMLQQIIEKTMRQIIAEPPEYFSVFHEDFLNDEELKITLGPHCNMILSLSYRHLAMINRQIASESTEAERVFYLQEFFYYMILDPAVTNLLLHLSDIIQQVVKEQSIAICARLYEELLRDTRIKERCGEDIAVLSSLLNPSSQ